MAKITVTFTITEFCLHTGLSEEELNEIVGLGMIEPRQPQRENWLFDDSAVTIVHRAVRLRKELELDWPGIGQLAWQAIQQVDIPVIVGVTTVSAVAIVGGNLIADLVLPWVDPRIDVKK